MLLTLTNTQPPATDLGFLLHEHPDLERYSLGAAHVFGVLALGSEPVDRGYEIDDYLSHSRNTALRGSVPGLSAGASAAGPFANRVSSALIQSQRSRLFKRWGAIRWSPLAS